MKKTITSLLVVASLATLSCKKCATCTTTTTIQQPNTGWGGGYITTQGPTTTFDACGETLKEAHGNTTRSSYIGPLGEVISTTKTTCN
jgi:hypothetical protein